MMRRCLWPGLKTAPSASLKRPVSPGETETAIGLRSTVKRVPVRWDLENMNNLQVYLEEDEAGLQGFRTIHCTEEYHPYAGAYWPSGHIIGYEHTFINLFSELMKGIAEGFSPAPNFEDGLRNQLVLAAVEKSAQSGQWIKVSDLEPVTRR